MNNSLKSLIVVTSAALALLLTGCQMGKIELTGEDPINVPAATQTSGRAMGGQYPIAGMTMQLYAVGTTGYGSAATPLGASFMTTANGNFNFPSFSCTASTQIYLLGTGGTVIPAQTTPTVVAATVNPNAELIAGLGSCGTYTATTPPFVNINEMTSIATIWALSPFMTGPTSIGSSAANATGILNAFATIQNLVNVATPAGTAITGPPYVSPTYTPGPNLPTGAVIPTNELNTLGDMMEQCVNTGGLASGEPTTPTTMTSGCSNLFYYTKVGSSYPNDTVTAMMNIAQHPATNVALLNTLRSNSPVFVPALDKNNPPSDWTIAITYANGGLSTPQGVAIDQAGNVWVANSGNSSISEFSSIGAPISTSTGYTTSITAPYALAIDPYSNVWVANTSSVTKLYGYLGSAATATGATATTGSAGAVIITVASSTAAPISSPRSIAIDSTGNVFVPNTGASSVSLINSYGSPIYGSPITSSITAPAGVAISAK